MGVQAGDLQSSRGQRRTLGPAVAKTGTKVSPPTCPPFCPSLTLILLKDSPASHPAVGLLLEQEDGGKNADGLDVLVIGDRGGQPQQGQVVEPHGVFRVYNDVLHPVPARIGLPVPERRFGSKLSKLDCPLFWIKVPSMEGERDQDPREECWPSGPPGHLCERAPRGQYYLFGHRQSLANLSLGSKDTACTSVR